MTTSMVGTAVGAVMGIGDHFLFEEVNSRASAYQKSTLRIPGKALGDVTLTNVWLAAALP
jgi:hypothetical protein